LIDNLGPVERDDADYFDTLEESMFLPALEERFHVRSLMHAKSRFTDDRLASMEGAGLVHLGGHGNPWRITDGLTAGQLPRLKLAPCIVFSGACFTGVTHRWFDPTGDEVAERTVSPDTSFCLNLLKKDVIAYLASVHAGHGMPVYQEMEYLAYRGASLGDAIKHTYDGIVVGAGGEMPVLETLEDGMARPEWTGVDMMLKGTAARILLGDPSMVICEAFASPPFSTSVEADSAGLRITATMINPDLRCTFADTYHNDRNPEAPHNDRALVVVDWPDAWNGVQTIEDVRVRAGGRTLPYRVVGYALEEDGGTRRLHVQIDVPGQGFYTSALRIAGATVEFTARRQE
jgi:hypothetical protein